MYEVKVFTVNGNTGYTSAFHSFDKALNEYHRLVGRYVVEGVEIDWLEPEGDYDEVPSDHAAKVTFTYPTGHTIEHRF